MREDIEAQEHGERPGRPSVFTCPGRDGVMWEMADEHRARFRCHEGRAYSADTMLSGRMGAVEAALWHAVRMLDERAMLSRRPGRRGTLRSAARFEDEARAAERDADLVRSLLRGRSAASPMDEAPIEEPVD